MSRYRPEAPPIGETHEDALVRRAARFRRKGEGRRAMVALREAALGNDSSARLWTLYGVQCARLGRLDAAARALSQAIWLRDQAGETGKARATRRLLERTRGDAPFA